MLRVRKFDGSRDRTAIERFSLRRTLRSQLLISFDTLAIGSTFIAAFVLVGRGPFLRGDAISWTTAGMAIVTVIGLYLSGLYRRSWRFFSFAHSIHLVVLTLPCISLGWAIALLSPTVRMEHSNLLAVMGIHWLLATSGLVMLRALRRLTHERLTHGNGVQRRHTADRQLPRALLVGSPDWVLSIIEMLRRETTPSFVISGVLLPNRHDTLMQIGNVPVLGCHEDIVSAIERLEAKGHRPSLVIASDDGNDLTNREMARLTSRAHHLNLELSRIRDCWSHILQRSASAVPEELSVKDLLGRSEFTLESEQITSQVSGKCVLVTGGGGTIGSELCWQLASFRPSTLVVLDHSEYHLYAAEMKLRERFPNINIKAELCNIRERAEVCNIFARHRPAIVYHAAALKHVPIVETNPCAGVHTNILGTRIVADAVCEFGATAMVQVSTDKAVNPVGMMGATKRVGELYCQALDMCGIDDPDAPRFMTVRFGNVLGSSGSIVPLFQRQLREGRPLTVTHPDIERFFMTVREAVQLILQSSAAALSEQSQRGTIFVLDMGKPVRIVDLAYRMIRLYGLQPEIDVPLQFVGLRPGEKLYEELFDICEEQTSSRIKGIFEAQSRPIPLPLISRSIDDLARAVQAGDQTEARRITHALVKMPSSVTSFQVIENTAMMGEMPRANEHAPA
ncbi:polysaccharide biosynthesis protein [Novosphingobium profundi]|uniref:polysaccharide biosynthesis protein n=1 Tax=Novosphingobium profundi TaxID=1774954 RepID=UPI001BDA47AC|nr:nucleoside-diphosphate sugar epimerase/dehydratase [Novosphingobium profundi]MBT0667226.1 polysaccharide biosynthesis protein [Novosphingobium profundi]